MARCKEDILAAKGVKPTLSPNLNVLATVEALDVKRLLFIGVGCQARRSSTYLGFCMQAPVFTLSDTACSCVARSRRCAASKNTCSWISSTCLGYADCCGGQQPGPNAEKLQAQTVETSPA